MSVQPKPTTPGVRRVPTQERSRRRFEAILDASALLFAEHGYAAVSVEAIAERAGIPIGSVYQFFRDKEALFAAVAERCNQRSEAAFDLLVRAAESEPSPPWEVVLDSVIDGFALLSESDPSFRAVNRNVQFMGDSMAKDEQLNARIASRAALLLARYAPSVPAARRRLVATMLVDVVTGVLVIAARRDDRSMTKHIAELKTLVRVYVRHALASDEAAPAPKKKARR